MAFSSSDAARKAIVEPVFGQIKQARGFRRFFVAWVAKSEGGMGVSVHGADPVEAVSGLLWVRGIGKAWPETELCDQWPSTLIPSGHHADPSAASPKPSAVICAGKPINSAQFSDALLDRLPSDS
jgi:hypothetical protein